MMDDPKKELELLQEQFLKNDEWFEKELDSAKRMIGMPPEKAQSAAAPRKVQSVPVVREQPAAPAEPKAVPVYNTTVGPIREEMVFENPQTEEAPMPGKAVKRLATLVGLEILGILGVAAYWLLFILR